MKRNDQDAQAFPLRNVSARFLFDLQPASRFRDERKQVRRDGSGTFVLVLLYEPPRAGIHTPDAPRASPFSRGVCEYVFNVVFRRPPLCLCREYPSLYHPRPSRAASPTSYDEERKTKL